MSSESTTETARVPVVPTCVTEEMSLGYVGDVRFHALVLQVPLRHAAQSDWATSAPSLDTVLPYAVATGRWHGGAPRCSIWAICSASRASRWSNCSAVGPT